MGRVAVLLLLALGLGCASSKDKQSSDNFISQPSSAFWAMPPAPTSLADVKPDPPPTAAK